MNRKETAMVTFALMLSNAMSGLNGTITNTAIPAIVSSLHGIQFMGWIVAIYLLGESISIPIWTKIGERITNKIAFGISVILFILGAAMEGMAPNICFLLFARMIMGIGGGGMGSLPYIIIGYMFKNITKRTEALGLLTASHNGAAILGPLIGGSLIDALSWRWVFYMNIPIGLLAFIVFFIFYKSVNLRKESVFDVRGMILLIISLLMFLMGIQLLKLASTWIVIMMLIISIICFICFLYREKNAEDPIIPLSIFKIHDLNGDFYLFAITWGAYIAVNTYLPMWAQALLGTTALIGGMTLMPNSIIEVLSSQTVAPLRRHFSSFALITFSIVAMLISSIGMFASDLRTPLSWLTIIAAFSGLGVGIIFVTLQVKVQIDAGKKEMATATSTSFLVRIIAQTLMSAIYGVIMNLVLTEGISKYKGITMNMMNKLSNPKTAKFLPINLIPIMRAIFCSGIRIIMLVSAILLIIAMIINFYYNWSERKEIVTK